MTNTLLSENLSELGQHQLAEVVAAGVPHVVVVDAVLK